ncbi:hypothetical protein [Abyssisolibacter fermentans]|uniref:hypothetical protein n=1 Tax=Abyssisolibacter fermentans TaxID=1766203 RepID=UPI000836AF79|nr:hypothetical protein [Abyssisolibacter fermentans]
MGKYEQLADKVEFYLDNNRLSEIQEFLIENSNLPGRRANLELAKAFGDYFEGKVIDDELWDMLHSFSSINNCDAPTNDPKEFLPFCALQAFGSIYLYLDKQKRAIIFSLLKNSMNDPRWRIREAVAMSFQRIAEKDFQVIRELISFSYKDSNFLEKRAFACALAHPPILSKKENVLFCLHISEEILKDINNLNPTDYRNESFKILQKGMEYAISVFVAELPTEGFNMMKNYAMIDNEIIKKIIKSNINKNRLRKKYIEKVDEISDILITD